MKEEIYRSQLASAKGDARFFKLSFFALIALAIIEGMVIFSQVGDQRVVVVPPEIEKTFWVEKGKVSQEYLEQMALFIAQLQLTVAPNSHDFQSKTILQYVHPSAIGGMKSDLAAIGTQLKSNNMSTWFKADQIQTSVKSSRVVVGGELVTYVGKEEVSRKQKAYRAQFLYINSRLYLTEFKEVDTRDPFDTQKTISGSAAHDRNAS